MRRPTREGFGVAAAVAFFASGGIAAAAVPMSPDEVRDQRLIREARPPWRAALALPDDLLHVLVWPIEQGLFWAERVDLPDRVAHLLGAPFGSTSDTAEER